MAEKVCCPYNKNHQIKPEKLVSHVVKCPNKNSNHHDLQCPYNSLHFIPEDEFENHVTRVCPQRPNLEQLDHISEINSSTQKNSYEEHSKKKKNYEKEEKKREKKEKFSQNYATNTEKKPNTDKNSNVPASPATIDISEKTIGSGEGFTLKRITRVNAEEELKKKNEEIKQKNEETRKKDCDSQIF